MEKTREEYTKVINDGVAQRDAVETAVKAIYGKGCKNIFLVGCGGSLAVMSPMRYFVEKYSELPVYEFNSNEFVHMKPRQFCSESMFITSSYTGTTPETVAAAKYAKECGAHIIAFTGNLESPLAQTADYSFACGSKLIIMYQIIFCMLNLHGDFPEYDKMQSILSKIADEMYDAKLAAEPKAKEFAATYKDEKFFFVTGSGAGYGECYTYGNCILEEMQWIYAHPVHAGEFFHGAFEMLTEESPIIVLQGEDATRPLSDRVLAFAKRYTKKIIHVDTAEYADKMPSVTGIFREVFTPFMLTEILAVYSYELSVIRNHPLSTRRYMFKVQY